ncbi:Nidogen-1 [Orchesella cincta]|uniref:Nidogen-1 n=1 Tax=Orchesella cincta TaxID=48709 RepID=A0A1D2N2Y1_ORCCI|nr:Nidogen-1 [Orchesella cincta]
MPLFRSHGLMSGRSTNNITNSSVSDVRCEASEFSSSSKCAPARTNTYQLVIASDGGESYVAMIYDKIDWIQGTGKNPNLPDAKAQAGLIAGNGGPHYSLRGSGTDQVSSLNKRSNINEDGVWAFRIGRIGDQVEQPDLNVNLESSSEASSSCAAGGFTSCHSSANCVDYEPGFCCQCTRGFYGNGRVCLQNGTHVPVRFNGKVKGVLNGMAIDDADLFSYILPQDGRSYTAVAKIPERLGYDLQSVIVLGTSIGWLFSTSARGAPNGFMLTGGLFNYTADINFFQTGQKVQVHQSFLGLDVFSHMRVDTRLHGSLPLVPVGKSIEIVDLKMEFTRVAPGTIRSRSSHTYRVEGTSVDNPFSLVQTIEYNECPWAAPVPPELDTTTMKVGKNYIVYDSTQGIGRYAITSTITPVDGNDPCKENKDKCGPNSSCVVEGDNFRCICNLGYEQHYNYEATDINPDDPPQCVDINECQIGTSTCDVTAVCINYPGSYRCECPPGHSGDGYTCTNNSPPDCRQVRDLCDPFAECIYSRSSDSYICSCQPGYHGDGLVCHREPTESCEIENNCHPEADCRLDESAQEYICVCRSGYQGDGYVCMRSGGHDGHGREEAVPPPICVLGSCYCSTGYEYDDLRGVCVPVTEVVSSAETNNNNEMQCDVLPQMCDINAVCMYNSNIGRYACKCKTGYAGSGRECSPQDFCSSHSECSAYGECAYDSAELRYSCRCREGFTGDGKECRPKSDVGCDILRNCDSNAQCTWDSAQTKYACECQPGYKGDGLMCQEDLESCNVLQNCGENAECGYESESRSYKCQCLPGYEGDGFRCRSAVPCYQDPLVCDANAVCSVDQRSREWTCQCKPGYQGDGHTCKEVIPMSGGDFLVVTKGMSLIKVPLGNGRAVPLVVEPFQTAIGLDIDCPNQQIYWSDVATRTIKMASFNGTDRGTFLDDEIGSPEGLAIDPVSQTIYWTDSLKDTIEVASLKSKLRATIISTGLVNPRGIAVFPQRGRLFWSDWNRDYPKIEYSGLDGRERQILVGEGLALPNSLVVDKNTEELCWADAGTHKIECVGIDGRNRRNYVSKIKYPFGLAIGPESFYWSDWETKKVERASRQSGELSTGYDVHLGGTGKLYGIVYVAATCPNVYSPCDYNSCGEERLCLPNARNGRSCICPDGAVNCQNLL